ncbi:MAG: hypothetical protein JWO38_3015 [Gemmataceae bacterium]|nr:hypothetical protein [Gemmataceae bacterium]
MTDVYRYAFRPEVPITEVEQTLVLAIIATEALHGESQARLDLGHAFDAGTRACVIDARTGVGRDFNRLFVGFVTREFGPDAFTVERLPAARPEPAVA